MREMKDSGVAWIGEIPNEWESVPAGGLFTEVKEKNTTLKYTNPLQFKYGEIVDKNYVGDLDANMLNTLQTYSCVAPNTIMINGLNLNYDFVSQRVAIVTKPGVITSAYLGVVPKENLVLPYYACYLLKGYDGMQVFHGMGSGVRKTLQWKDFKILRFVLPPLPEQRRIAEYLDTACSKVDALIANQQAQIEKLKTYKQSLITEVVTHGLDPDAPMKDSGVEWIGMIPEGWEVIYPKALFSLRKEKAKIGDKQLTASQQYGVIFQDEYMALTGSRVVLVDKDFEILKHVAKGDFVISMRSFQGGLEYSEHEGSISSAYVMLKPNLELVVPRFYKWLLKSQSYIRALQSTSNLVRDGQAMRFTNFVQVPLLIVPKEEQQQIADYLDGKCSKIDALIAIKQQKIDKLTQYKKSLIYEYVTGKKEAT